ncbi:hypothetical protein HXS70_09415 [Akkermansia muciniphila]|uniref:hypothetical protein n=1 Tax=Akkermansia muciniphila TaxID=239935 RepID=UPI001601F3BF|nr:hypothetical protein [Akkermansia muciniphila]QNB44064.1 hypothetical protein HXS70_09415 [Akkermansia muciniphila]
MSESLPPEKGANDRAFGVACWTLGGLAFVLLLMVGVSFSLSVRTVVVEKVVEKPVPVPAREKPERSAGVVEDGAAEETVHMADVPVSPSEKPRSVEEMLREADLSDPAADSVPVAAAVAGGGTPLAGHPFLLRIRTRSCPP